MSKLTLVYRISTGLIVLIMGISAVSYLLRVPHFVESTRSLGYPTYLMSLLGVAKLLGLVALLVPGWPRLKEWAYAGFAINLIGATWSHLAVGQYDHAPLSVAWLAVLMTSYVTFHRRLVAKESAAAPAAAVPSS